MYNTALDLVTIITIILLGAIVIIAPVTDQIPFLEKYIDISDQRELNNAIVIK